MPSVEAQTDRNAHLWFRGSLEVQPAERWMIRHETYFRRSEWGQTWQQIVTRTALQFRTPPSMLWSVGHAFYWRYPYGRYNPPYNHVEHQLMLMHHFTPRFFERTQPLLRTRFEHRWYERQETRTDPESGTQRIESFFVQSSRIRLQLGILYTFDRAKQWRFEVLNETFFTLDRPVYRQIPTQNRLLLGFTHRPKPSLALSLWFLHQWINPTTPRDEQNFTLFLAVNWRIKTFRSPPAAPEEGNN